MSGTKDLEAAAKYKAALETHLPQILKVALGVVPKLGDVLGNAKTTLEGGIAAGKAATAGRATAAAHLGQCLVTPFMGGIDAVVGLQATVSVSVDIKASATASTSPRGSTKEGEANEPGGSGRVRTRDFRLSRRFDCDAQSGVTFVEKLGVPGRN